MRIIPLVAVYQEQPEQLAGLFAQLEAHFPQVVIVIGDDYAYPTPAAAIVRRVRGVTSERRKRNALLELAHDALEPTRDDWLLSIDPDERLVGAATLTAVLAESHWAPRVAFPLLRQELDGRVWAMPCKLFRGNARRYVHLDTHLAFPSTGAGVLEDTWDLDPYQVARRGVILPGYPGLLHLRSRRADTATDSFYTEPDPAPGGLPFSELETDPEGVIHLEHA